MTAPQLAQVVSLGGSRPKQLLIKNSNQRRPAFYNEIEGFFPVKTSRYRDSHWRAVTREYDPNSVLGKTITYCR
jgi:hypothetical protein